MITRVSAPLEVILQQTQTQQTLTTKEQMLNRNLFKSQGRAGGQGSYLKLVTRFFQTKYPDFTSNQYGYDISTRPLFEAVCFNCSRMIRKKERHRLATFQPEKPLEDEETLESTVPIEQHYDAAFLADVNYVAV
ncbi:hypothetical protein BV898_10320 [Hypsibius exemplaris]|uniref:Uncharacterized protein n=1 Tax=Hypsibius exemplaris TaxID=2072580 RepID=A0A1W0WJQ7_HYPEX|nr:hypothetical protein BV898_10320 [Hypsibius exemplaris]